ncbi:UNVERIFIED_CONTAM: hypothetical protein FKN15_038891 [Acipenser sinensis]
MKVSFVREVAASSPHGSVPRETGRPGKVAHAANRFHSRPLPKEEKEELSFQAIGGCRVDEKVLGSCFTLRNGSSRGLRAQIGSRMTCSL